MLKKTVGGTLLIIGTTVGAGMLSLPIVVASSGFGIAVLLLLVSWNVMYITALKLLRVCSEYEVGANFTTILENRAPKYYQIFFAIIYLLLLYSLMSAYTTQGASLVGMLGLAGGTAVSATHSSVGVEAVIFILIFASFMYSYRVSDYANRVFVFMKLIFFIFAIAMMIVYISPGFLNAKTLSIFALIYAWPTLLPSFGFHNIIPVLYEYQNGDIKSIKKSIFVGSVSVLIIYLVWVFLALALIPQQGAHSYQTMFQDGNNTPNGLMEQVRYFIGSENLEICLQSFIHIAIITSFIGVGVSLVHYIRDIFSKFGKKINNIGVSLMSFIPPLIFTVFYPKGFILALQYAAIFAVIIFVYTPTYLDRTISKSKVITRLYVTLLGSLVIVCQIINLVYANNPFGLS